MFIDPTIAQVTLFAGNFAPRNWAFCNGQLAAISQNTALFSILGTMYGGNGQTTFALPDLRGRVAIHAGQGPGLINHTVGEQGGTESVTLTINHLPAHTHPLVSATGGQAASSLPGTTDIPTNNYPAVVNGSGNAYSTSPSAAKMAASDATSVSVAQGSSQHISIMPPYLGMNYIICLFGAFPSRN
jgi:microcystin-dependent protein